MRIGDELCLISNESVKCKIIEEEHPFLFVVTSQGKREFKYSNIEHYFYNVLDSLIAKGLVEVIPEKTKKFVPSSPEDLIKLIDMVNQNNIDVVLENIRKFINFKPAVISFRRLFEREICLLLRTPRCEVGGDA